MCETNYNPREIYELLHTADPDYSGDRRSHGRGLEPLVAGDSLLDVGAGKCLFVADPAFRDMRTVAVDISDVAVDALIRQGVHAQRAEIQALPFSDNAFDTACAFDVLEHVPPDQVDKAISELKRVARLRVLLTIGKRPHVHSGYQLHLTLKPFAEWAAMLEDETWVMLYKGEDWSPVSYMYCLEARNETHSHSSNDDPAISV